MTTPEPEVHSLYGLTIASEVPLHQDRRDAADVEPDVELRWAAPMPRHDAAPPGRVLAHLETDRPYYTFTVTDAGDYVLRFFGVCDFVVDPSTRVVRLHVVEGADAGVAGILAAGALLSFIMTVRGELVLHASAVQVGDAAVAFVGRSGMGKSTMATLMCASGALLVTDDVLRLDRDGSRFECRLGATELRLRKAAAQLSAHFPAPPPSRVTSDDRDALRIPESTHDRLPLAAIVVPFPDRDRTTADITRVRPVEALISLLSFPRLLGWTDPVVLDRQFHHTSEVAEHVPVFVAHVPWGPPFPTDVAQAVVDAVGLGAAAESRPATSRGRTGHP